MCAKVIGLALVDEQPSFDIQGAVWHDSWVCAAFCRHLAWASGSGCLANNGIRLAPGSPRKKGAHFNPELCLPSAAHSAAVFLQN